MLSSPSAVDMFHRRYSSRTNNAWQAGVLETIGKVEAVNHTRTFPQSPIFNGHGKPNMSWQMVRENETESESVVFDLLAGSQILWKDRDGVTYSV
jgi:hypothetical protein